MRDGGTEGGNQEERLRLRPLTAEMANWAGVGASLSAIVRPSIFQPRLSVPSIAHLDWQRLKHQGGVTGVVIDKDNCIVRSTLPSLAACSVYTETRRGGRSRVLMGRRGGRACVVCQWDGGRGCQSSCVELSSRQRRYKRACSESKLTFLVLESVETRNRRPRTLSSSPSELGQPPADLRRRECLDRFKFRWDTGEGPAPSPSAFLSFPPLPPLAHSLQQAENVSRNMGVPVLVHQSPKPGYPCVKQVAAHFLLPRTSLLSSPSASPALAIEDSSSSSSTPPSLPLPTTAASRRGQVVFSPLARSRAALAVSLRHSPSLSPTFPPSTPRLLVIGDRLATDMILSHRLSRLPLPLTLPSSAAPASSSTLSRALSLFRRPPPTTLGTKGQRIETIAVLTTTLHAREGLGTTLLRTVERVALWGLQKRQRRRDRRDASAAGTKLKGVEGGRGVESIQWERFLTDYEPPVKPIEAAPLPVPVVAPPTPAHSTTPVLPLLQRLQSLPAVLPLIPSRLGNYLSSLPTHLLTSLRTLRRRSSSALERSLPRFLASLHLPLSRLVSLYATPSRDPSMSSSPLAAYTDATLDRAEAVVGRLQERVGGPLRGLGALARVRAEEVERLRKGGLGALGWKGKERKVKVEGKEV